MATICVDVPNLKKIEAIFLRPYLQETISKLNLILH